MNNINDKKDSLYEELSLLEKIKYSIKKYKINNKEQKIIKEKRAAQAELEKIKKELDKALELDKITKQKLEKEKQELESINEQTNINSKRIDQERKRLEQEKKRILEEQQKKQEEELIRKQQEEERELEKKRLEQERIEREKAEARERKRLEQERIEKEKAETRERKRLEQERLEQEKLLKRKKIEEQLKKEEEARKNKIYEQEKEKNKIEEERKAILKQIETISEHTKKEERAARKLKLQISDNEKHLLSAQEELLEKDLEINSEKLKLANLNKLNADEKTKNNIIKKEERIKTLLNQKQELIKNISVRKKELERQKKSLIREEKIDDILNEFNNVKKEVVKDDETLVQVTDKKGKKHNIFKVSFDYIIYYIFRKTKNIEYIKDISSNIKIKITISLMLSMFLTIITIALFAIVIPGKDSYSENNYSNQQENNNVQPVEEKKTENNQNENSVDRISNKALEEEIEAQQSSKSISYYFTVNRTIKIKEKLHTFSSPNWSDISNILAEGTTVKVDLLTSPGGYMMYRISDGEHTGKYITANNNLVTIENQNDAINTQFISKPIAIKILDNTESYSNLELTSSKSTVYKGVTLNISGMSISSNNRLIYHITNGTYVPVDFSKTSETQRATITQKDKDDNSNSSSPTNKSSNN